MVNYYGDFAEDDTVNIPFNTFTSDDPAASSTITELADADIKVHKDGSATPIATDGATVAINLNSITGSHMITINTSVDAAYSTGSEYSVRIEGTVVDGGTINAWVGSFSIERAGGALAVAKTIKTETALILADTADIQPNYATSSALGTVDTEVGALQSDVTLILADTAELQSDDTPLSIAALQTDLDTLTAGVTLAADAITSAKIADNAFLAVNFAAGSLDGKGNWNIGKTGYALTVANWNVGKTGYSLTTANWNVGKTGYALTVAPLTASEVNAEVLDVLNVDTFAEPGQGAPGATITLAAKINYLYKAWRNQSKQNATTYELYNSAANTVDQKATVSDDATDATKGVVVSGP